MSIQKIKQTELELKKISGLRKELEVYEDSTLKTILLKTCSFCELILKKELERLHTKIITIPPIALSSQDLFESMSRDELEKAAFDVHTPDDAAQLALKQLLTRFASIQK